MGAKLSLLAPSAPTVAISSYVDILENIQYIELMNNSRFLKTIKAIDLNNGDAIVIKVLIKPSNNIANYNINLHPITESIVKEATLLSQSQQFQPWHKIIETDRAGYLIRQSIKSNLYDRLSIRPFLEPIEKLFLIFQLLKMVENLHENLHICHGDIKLENLMVSTSNWLTLVDFSSHLKPIYLPEDNPNQFFFYFDTSGRRVCNLAPERFYNSSKIGNADTDNSNNQSHLTQAMDLFGLGCVIGELYLDGEPLFTLSGLFKYIKNEYTPDLTGVDNNDIKTLIASLIKFDPKERPLASHWLSTFKNTCFPQSFYDFIFEFIEGLNNSTNFTISPNNDNITPSDLRIDYIYKNFGEVSKNLQFDYPKHYKSNHNYPFMFLNLPSMPKNYAIKNSLHFINSNNLQKSALIILNYVFSLINSLKQPASKTRACELIVALSERVNDECKLDRSLPYLCKLLDEYIDNNLLNQRFNDNNNYQPNKVSSKVVIVALDAITVLLNSCSYVTPLNALMFPEYLIPKLSKLANIAPNEKENELIRIKLASCIPMLARIADKFWMMTKTFKTGTRKEFEGQLDPSLNNTSYNTLSIPRESLSNEFQEISILLLTDSSAKVRMSLVSHIEPLCRFFGVDKANDVILPHLITYLNDPDHELRLAFLNSILVIGPYLGILSFEQYLLPLLIQTLSDPEQLVALKVLEIFTKVVADKLINPVGDFNALSVYKELLSNTVHLFLHPNEWIRQAVLDLVLAISSNLLDADKFCFLHHEIERYLSYDVTSIDWSTLYPCLTRPLSKIVYQFLIVWKNNASEKSLFWKQKSFANTEPSKVTSFTKDMGKSIFLSSSNNEVPSFTTSLKSPLSQEDKQWLLKLKSVGLEEKDYWKIFTLRNYVNLVSKTMGLHINKSTSKGFPDISMIDLSPRNVFFDISYKSEPIAMAKKVLETNISQNDYSINSNLKSDQNPSSSFLLPNINKVSASIQTIEENVFGELEINNSNQNHHHNNHHHNNHHHNNHDINSSSKTTSDTNTNHKVISTSDDKVILSTMRHSYNGHNPHILNYLLHVDFDLDIDCFSEFGDTVKTKRLTPLVSWNPQGTCINTINTNNSSGEVHSINCTAVNPTSEFFVTGSDSGLLKAWDTSKLVKNVLFKNSSLTLNLNSSIIKICFMKKRDVIAVSTRDGYIRIFRIDISRGKNKKIAKYSKFSLIRKYKLNEEQFSTFLVFETNPNNSVPLLICSTSKSKVIGFNIITMGIEFSLQNPLIHGTPICFMVNYKRGWLMIGTDKGRLCLWDIRFEIMIKVWKFQVKNSSQTSPIEQLILLPDNYNPGKQPQNKESSHFAVIGGTNEPDITIWETANLELRQILSSQSQHPRIRHYQFVEIKETSNSLDSILEDLSLDLENNEMTTNHMKMKLYSHEKLGSFLINSKSNGNLIVWNINDIQHSKALGYKASYIENDGHSNFKVSHEKVNDTSPTKPSSVFATTTSEESDIINSIEVVDEVKHLIITGDRSGFIRIYV